MNKRAVRISLVFLLIVALLSGISVLQQRITSIQGKRWKYETMTYLPLDERVRPLFMGFDATYAHFLWIKTIIYVGDHYVSDNNYGYLIRLLDIITRLDPFFYPAYEFAGLLAPQFSKDPAAAKVILERGMTTLGKTKWNIPLYMALYYLKYENNKEMAAQYLAASAQVPGAPVQKLARTAAAFFEQTGNEHKAHEFLTFMLQTAENPGVKRYLASRLEKTQM